MATFNPHKLREFGEILEGVGVVLVSPADVGWDAEVEEDAATLEANAVKKARAGAEAAGLPALADDTGLFVDALGGAPGIHSARYAGPGRDAAANRKKLLRELAGSEVRTAVFRCVVALAFPGGGGERFGGECRGRILASERGDGGFGYDPLFEADSTGKTLAEMVPAEKNTVSHRGRALEGLKIYLETHRGDL